MAGEQGSRALRDALGRFATGVTVITTRTASGKAEGLTANSFSSLSLDPPLVLWNLQNTARSLPAFRAAEHFVVNVLASEQRPLSQHFARAQDDKFDGIDVDAGVGDCPVLPGSLAVIECRTTRQFDAGDHVLFIGEVLRFSQREGRPLVFSGGKYHQLAALRAAD
jgi:flavin reductase (DIM6/NTAB) family NADH-FMN oxidoreductase RutF